MGFFFFEPFVIFCSAGLIYLLNLGYFQGFFFFICLFPLSSRRPLLWCDARVFLWGALIMRNAEEFETNKQNGRQAIKCDRNLFVFCFCARGLSAWPRRDTSQAPEASRRHDWADWNINGPRHHWQRQMERNDDKSRHNTAENSSAAAAQQPFNCRSTVVQLSFSCRSTVVQLDGRNWFHFTVEKPRLCRWRTRTPPASPIIAPSSAALSQYLKNGRRIWNSDPTMLECNGLSGRTWFVVLL